MPKRSNFPRLYEEMRSFSIGTLLRLKILEPDVSKSERLIWTKNGYETASINITIVQPDNVMRLSYRANDESIKYEIDLECRTSNLGFGKVWYFICPVTGKRCKKLYGGKYFLHREAYSDAFYESQILPKSFRRLSKYFTNQKKREQYYDLLYKDKVREHYAGKPTKSYKRFKALERQKQPPPDFF